MSQPLLSALYPDCTLALNTNKLNTLLILMFYWIKLTVHDATCTIVLFSDEGLMKLTFKRNLSSFMHGLDCDVMTFTYEVSFNHIFYFILTLCSWFFPFTFPVFLSWQVRVHWLAYVLRQTWQCNMSIYVYFYYSWHNWNRFYDRSWLWVDYEWLYHMYSIWIISFRR